MDVELSLGDSELSVYVENRCVYTFSDVADGLPYPCDREDVQYLVDDLINQMTEDIADWQTSMTRFDKKIILGNLEKLKSQMVGTIYKEYGDAV